MVTDVTTTAKCDANATGRTVTDYHPHGVCLDCGGPTGRVQYTRCYACHVARLGSTRDARAAERFWAKVDVGRGCWLWTGSLTEKGYGSFWDGNRMVRAHRFAYEQDRGPIPDGLTLDHLCRTRACVRPIHLEPVTNAENHRRGIARHGETHPFANLSAQDIRAIRQGLEIGQSQSVLGNLFGVSRSAIGKIARGQTWKHVA